MKDSLFTSSIRALLIAFFSLAGIFLSLILMTSLISAISRSDDSIPNDFNPEIQANAKGERKKLDKNAPVILELDITGVIGSLEMNQKDVEKLLVESRENTLKDNRVKAILLKINTPGGATTDADGIYRAILAYKSQYKVPVYAYADGLLASGGMYVACAADKIYASDSTLVGSVGVITSSFINVSEIMQKLGVNALTVFAGKGKDELNPLRPWKPDEDQNIKEIVDYYYNSFVDIVAKHRKQLSKEALINDYGAKVFPAEVAASLGYIDGAHESRESTLKKLLAALSIEDDFYQVVSLKSSHWLNQIFNSDAPFLTGKIKHEITYEGQLPKELLCKPLYLYKP